MFIPVVLGRDILKTFGYTLGNGDLDKSNKAIEEIFKIEIDERFDICDTLPINPEIDYETQVRLKNLFISEYVELKRPEKPATENELKLILHSKPFSFTPRRLLYVEKEKLRNILEDLVQKEIIRPSESEYASPIVLVKKKDGNLKLYVDFRT